MTMSLLAGCGTQPTPPDPSVLVTAEHNFAAAAAAKGMRDAFLEFSAENGVMFVPGPVKVKEHYGPAPKRPGYLTWQPIYAEISSSGDLGWTTGPWEFRAEKATDTVIVSGHYNSIWRLQPDSTWKFVVDFGVAHRPHESAPPPPVLRVLDRPDERANRPQNVAREELVQLEYTFSAASAAEGLTSAYLPRLADDIRMYRAGLYPSQGVEAATALLASVDGKMTWETFHVDVARNADLGYAFGVGTWTIADGSVQFSFMHIWRRGADGAWKLALEVQTPHLQE